MTSRRGNPRHWRRMPGDTVAGPATSSASIAIAAGLTPLVFYRSDVVTLAGSNVSSWTDQGGSGLHAVQGTASMRPVYNASDAAFNGQPSIQSDGVDDELVAPLAVPDAAVSPRYYFFVFMQDAPWTGGVLIGGTTTFADGVIQSGSSPRLANYSGAIGPLNTGAPLGTAKRGEAWFTSSAASFLKLGATNTTGVDTGSLTAASFIMLYLMAGRLAEVLVLTALPDAATRAQLDAYASARYGATVLT